MYTSLKKGTKRQPIVATEPRTMIIELSVATLVTLKQPPQPKPIEIYEPISISQIEPLETLLLPEWEVVEPLKPMAVTAPLNSPGTNYNDMDYGYCTWYAKSRRPDLPTGLGNANTWYSRANSMGLPTGDIPAIGAVATTTRGSLGHVGIVDGINGSQVLISEMNVSGWSVMSQAWYPATDYLYIY